MTIDRRRFLRLGLSAGCLLSTPALAEQKSQLSTPPETEGPFYPRVEQKDKDFDLTRVVGQTEQAKGRVVIVKGRVLNRNGGTIPDVLVDIWQANSSGRYHHPLDRNPAPVDPGFQGWAMVPSGSEGEFRFRTVVPGAYPVSSSWKRPPHIHFKLSKRGYRELTTQMYFPDEPLNNQDRLLQAKSELEQSLMIARPEGKTEDGVPILYYPVVLMEA